VGDRGLESSLIFETGSRAIVFSWLTLEVLIGHGATSPPVPPRRAINDVGAGGESLKSRPASTQILNLGGGLRTE
jgi:hypothetical protein